MNFRKSYDFHPVKPGTAGHLTSWNTKILQREILPCILQEDLQAITIPISRISNVYLLYAV